MQVLKQLPDTCWGGSSDAQPLSCLSPRSVGLQQEAPAQVSGYKYNPQLLCFLFSMAPGERGLVLRLELAPIHHLACLPGKAGVMQPPLHAWCPSHRAEPEEGEQMSPVPPRLGCLRCPAPALQNWGTVQAAASSANGSVFSRPRRSAGSSAS